MEEKVFMGKFECGKCKRGFYVKELRGYLEFEVTPRYCPFCGYSLREEAARRAKVHEMEFVDGTTYSWYIDGVKVEWKTSGLVPVK